MVELEADGAAVEAAAVVSASPLCEGGERSGGGGACARAQRVQQDDLDSDGLLHAGGGGGGTSGAKGEGDGGSVEVRTPLAADSPGKRGGALEAAPRQQQQQEQRPLQQQQQQRAQQHQGAMGGLVSAVGREWLNVVADPNGRQVLVELAGTAAKEAARGASSALADRFHPEWALLLALAALLLAWCLQRLLAAVGGALLGGGGA